MPKNNVLEVLVSLHEKPFPQRTFLLNHCDSLTTKVPILRAWLGRPSILDFFQRIVWLTWDSSKYLRETFLVQNVTFDSICSILQFPPRRVLLSRTSEILKQFYCLDETMQKARKNLASQFAENNIKFCKQLLCEFYKEIISYWILCKTMKMILHAARTKWAESSQFKFKHVPFSWHFGWHLKIDSRSTRYPFCLRFWIKVCKSFPSCQINFSLQVSERYAFRVQFKNDSRSTRYAFCLRFWVKVRKSFVCCQINLSLKLAIQVSEGTHLTFSFRSMLQRPTNGYSKWQLQVLSRFDWKVQKSADLSLKWNAQHQVVP